MEEQAKKMQKQALKDTLARGVAFEEMTSTRGWKVVLGYFENRVKMFTNSVLMESDKDISEFEAARRELMGIRQVLVKINADIDFMKNDAKKSKAATKK